MAFNVRSGGLATSVRVQETVKSGDLVRAGELVGIAEIDATLGEDGNYYSTLALEGIAHSPIATATVSQGAPLYTSTASGAGNIGVTATLAAAGDKIVGVATLNKLAGETDVWYKLIPNVTVEVPEP